jgi:hypothetical protein
LRRLKLAAPFEFDALISGFSGRDGKETVLPNDLGDGIELLRLSAAKFSVLFSMGLPSPSVLKAIFGSSLFTVNLKLSNAFDALLSLLDIAFFCGLASCYDNNDSFIFYS